MFAAMAGAVSVSAFAYLSSDEPALLMPREIAVALFCPFAALICLQDCIRFINLLPIYTRSHLKTLPTVTQNRWWHVIFCIVHGVSWVVIFALPFMTVCMYVCMYVCMHGCIYGCMYGCGRLCVRARVCLCVLSKLHIARFLLLTVVLTLSLDIFCRISCT